MEGREKGNKEGGRGKRKEEEGREGGRKKREGGMKKEGGKKKEGRRKGGRKKKGKRRNPEKTIILWAIKKYPSGSEILNSVHLFCSLENEQ